MTLGQIMGRLVQEGLDRHDPARPPRGRRTGSRAARAAGAEQTSAAKMTASARGATSAAKQEARSDSAAPSAARVSAQAAESVDEAAPLQADRIPDRPDTSAATRRLGRQEAAACAKPAPPRAQNFGGEGGRRQEFSGRRAQGQRFPGTALRAVARWRRYHCTVCAKPARNEVRGENPSSLRARETSNLRRAWPAGRLRSHTIAPR